MKKLIVAIVSGPETREVEIPPGAPVRFGRGEPAEHRLPEDPYMSRAHFSIEHDGQVCRLRDLGSSNGVYVHGFRVPEATLASGDAFLAGRTRFAVRFEEEEAGQVPQPAAEPPAAVAPVALSSDDPLAPVEQRLVELLNGAPAPLFALLDAARDGLIREALKYSGVEYECLYEGQSADDLADFAPYLASVPKDSQFLRFLARKAWGHSWGLFVVAPASFADLRKHFRHFLMVELEGAGMKYFRFYDPRALRAFLPTCDLGQAREFFGPVAAFWMEGGQPRLLLKFPRGEGAPRPVTVDLEAAQPSARGDRS